jgi:parallel beta-helix repeat protein
MKIFVGVSGSFCAFDESTGELIWSYPIGDTDSSPAVAGGKVFVGSSDHKVYCFYAYEHDVATSELEVSFPVFPESSTEVNVSVYNSGLNDECDVEVQFLVEGSVVDSKIIPILRSMASSELTFSWTAPATPDIYELSVYVIPVPGETNTQDNSASRLVAVGGKIIEVPGDYPTIQQAVDAADPGDIIQVASGTYYENVVIDKSHLALIGEDRDTTIDGGGENYAICITADLVNISGFSVKHSRVGIIISSSNNNITNCNISNNSEGILLADTLNTIANCNVFNNDCHGIMIMSSENLIINCNISSNGQSESYLGHGIYFEGATYNKIISCKSENNDDGICLVGSTNNQIINCDIHSNRLVGLKLVYGYHGASSNNQITDCSVRNNEDGVYLFESYDNVLRGNSIWDNIYNFGVYARDTWRYNQDIDTSNTIEGESIYYMVEEANITIDGATLDVGYLGLISCDNIRVKNLKVSQNYQGLLLASTTNTIIENCDLSNNVEGIHLFCSSHNNISNSNTQDNTCGIHFYGNGPSNAVTNCNILNNCNEGIYFGSNSGGGTVANCTILNNGKGIHIDSWMTNKITTCKISKNRIGIYAGNSFNQHIKNCIISNNDEDGVYLSATQDCSFINDMILDNGNRGIFCAWSPNTITNCILWGNSDDLDGAGGTATYSDIEDGDLGEGNICADPMFVDAAGGDYHLQSTQGSYHGGAWTPDANTSPCIDAGDPTSPYGNEPEPKGNRINMGAYGNTDQASKSPTATLLNITQAQTDKSTYALNENVMVSCIVQNEAGYNITADSVDAQ